MAHKKGSFPHKFKVGQVVFWGNGMYRYVKIMHLNPLHCDGGCPSYEVRQGGEMEEFHHSEIRWRDMNQVSEDVLRPLNTKEKG